MKVRHGRHELRIHSSDGMVIVWVKMMVMALTLKAQFPSQLNLFFAKELNGPQAVP